MLKRNRSAARVGAEGLSGVVDTLRPIVHRAMADPELHDALRRALDASRSVSGAIDQDKPGASARKLAKNRKLQKEVRGSAEELRDAVQNVVSPPRPRFFRKLMGFVGFAAAAGAIAVAAKKLRGGDGPPA